MSLKPLVDKARAGLDLNSGDIAIAVTLLLSDQVEDEAKAEFRENWSKAKAR